jgi:hypothetical protein
MYHNKQATLHTTASAAPAVASATPRCGDPSHLRCSLPAAACCAALRMVALLWDSSTGRSAAISRTLSTGTCSSSSSRQWQHRHQHGAAIACARQVATHTTRLRLRTTEITTEITQYPGHTAITHLQRLTERLQPLLHLLREHQQHCYNANFAAGLQYSNSTTAVTNLQSFTEGLQPRLHLLRGHQQQCQNADIGKDNNTVHGSCHASSTSH